MTTDKISACKALWEVAGKESCGSAAAETTGKWDSKTQHSHCCTLERWHTGACMHKGEGGLTVPRVTGLLPSLPPEMARVTLPVGEGEPEADTLIVRDPRQLGKVNPASRRHALSDSHPQLPTYSQAQ